MFLLGLSRFGWGGLSTPVLGLEGVVLVVEGSLCWQSSLGENHGMYVILVHSLEEAVSSVLDQRRAGCQQGGRHSLQPRHRKGFGLVCAEPHPVSVVLSSGKQFSESFLRHLCSRLSSFWTHLLSILQIHSHHQMLPKRGP